MTTPRRATALAAAALIPALAVPALATTTAPLALSRTVVVESAHSGVVDVLVPEDAQVAVRGGVTIQGRGRLVGVWLDRVDGAYGHLASYRLPAFAGGRQQTSGSTASGRCKGVPSDTLPITSDCTSVRAPASVLLAEGAYRMTVLTDGQPLRITLRMTGLGEGTTQVPALRRLASVQKALPVRDEVGSSLVTFGASARVHGPTQTFVLATEKGRAGGAVSSASVCERPDEGTAPLAFGPLCAGGSSGGYEYSLSLGGQGTSGAGAFASSSSDAAGTLGLGGSFTSSSGVVFGQALGVWLQRP